MENNDNFGTPQQYMTRFKVKESTFYMRVKRGIIQFDSRGRVDYASTNAAIRNIGRPLKSNVRKRIKIGWTVSPDEYAELNQIHRKHQRHV